MRSGVLSFVVSFVQHIRSPLFSFVTSLVRILGTGLGGGQKGCLQRTATARTADRKRTVHVLAMI